MEIPESVELIVDGAFGDNRELFRNNHINTDRFKLRNTYTLVIDQLA